MNKPIFSAFLSVLLFFAIESSAQWKKMEIEGGVSLKIVKTDLYAFTITQYGLFKSDLNLTKWNKVDISFPFGSTIYSEDNVLMIINSGTNSPILISKDYGDSWRTYSYDMKNVMKNPIKFKGLSYLVMQNLQMDTTLLYELKNDSLKKISTYPINYSIFSSQDTIFYKNNSTNRYYYSTKIDSLTIIPQDLFIVKLSNLSKHQGKFYGVYQNKSIYYSSGDGLWSKVTNFPVVSAVNTYCIVDSTLFFNTVENNKIVLYCLPNLSGNWIKLNSPNAFFKNIIRIGNNYVYSSNFGNYQFNLNNTWTYKMNGIQLPTLTYNMYQRGNNMYMNIRDSLYITNDNGQSAHPVQATVFNSNASTYFEINNLNFVVANGVLYRADIDMQNFSKCILPDTNYNSCVFIGTDDSSFYLNVYNKFSNAFYILSSKDGISFQLINNYFNGSYFRASYIYYEADTLYAIEKNKKIEYFSITKGKSWQGTKKTIPGYSQYDITVSVFKKYAGHYFLYLLEYGRVDDIYHYLMKQNGNWVIASTNYNYIYSSESTSEGNISYKFENRNNLFYTIDSLKTFVNTNIDFNIVPGQYVSRLFLKNNTIYVEMSGGGIWYRSYSVPTQILTSKKKSELKLYPNPATDVIHLQLNNPTEDVKSISIYSIQGQLITEYNAREVEKLDGIVSINLQQLIPGNYLIRMLTNEQVYSAKFVFTE